MKVTSFAIQEILVNGTISPQDALLTSTGHATPALVDLDPDLRSEPFRSDPVAVITSNLRQPTSLYLVLGLEFEDGEADRQHNIGVFLTNPLGEKDHHYWWIFTPGQLPSDGPDLPEDRSFRLVHHEFSFTFIREGQFTISLELWTGNAANPMTRQEWDDAFVEVLAALPIDVLEVR